jgi:hypothetical protein
LFAWGLLPLPATFADVRVVTDRNGSGEASDEFQFPNVPPPARNDAAADARFSIISGDRDNNGATTDALHDGRVPDEPDAPGDNFFFQQGDDGRLLVDLGRAVDIKAVNTYSWHPNSRGPQVYTLYAVSDTNGADLHPARDAAPEMCGWVRLAAVDTRPDGRAIGGQYGVSVSSSNGALGSFRYLLFDCRRTETDDPFGNTFYSEIDVLDAQSTQAIETVQANTNRELIVAGDGQYEITVDTHETPDLTGWAHTRLAPVVQEWYPRIAKLLPGDGFQAPRRVTIVFRANMRGVAATGGTRVECAASWFRSNLRGEARGSIVHELVHVVQHYGARRARGSSPAPGWLVEGIADYVRWFLYEPQSHGAVVRKGGRSRYDEGYRVSANFLDWATVKYDKDLVPALNAALREGSYREDLWQQRTGHTLAELGDEWKQSLE